MENQEVDTWIMRGFRALDFEGNGFLVKHDLLSVFINQGVLHHHALQDLIEMLEKKRPDERI